MSKKTLVTGLMGLIGMITTAGVIGYVIGDWGGIDIELFLEMLLIFLPPIMGSICTTLFVKSIHIKQEQYVEIDEES